MIRNNTNKASQEASKPSALRGNSLSEGQQARVGANIILAAGGTGGHVFTAIAVAEELLKRGYKIIFATDKRGVLFLKTSGYEYKIISSASPNGISELFKLFFGTLQSAFMLIRNRPKIIIGFGGYPSFPPLMAAKLLCIKTILHEQNSVLGKANRFLAKSASAVATAFPETKNASNATYTGQPVRKEITAAPYPQITDNINILITGGSQGAKLFADVMPDALCQLAGKIRVIHQVPEDKIPEVKAKYDFCGLDYEIKTFFDDMPQRLQAAHLLICRAGSATIFELATVGRPAIFIPLKIAADNHQYYNAKSICDISGGWLIEEKNFNSAAISVIIDRLLLEPQKLAAAAENIRKFTKPNAAAALADLGEKLINK